MFEGNLLFNVVQDTGEHGATNSWDRQPMIWLADGSPTGQLTTAPAMRRIRGNMVFRNSFRGPTSNKWCLDKDDGSSDYEEEGNVLLYGAIKDRDGLWRLAHGNLLAFPELMPFEDTTNTKMAMAYQVNGLGFDQFFNNTVLTTRGEVYDCGGGRHGGYPIANASNMHDNTILFVTNFTSRSRSYAASQAAPPFVQDGCAPGSNLSFAEWQQLGFDKGSTLSFSDAGTAELLAMIRRWLPKTDDEGLRATDLRPTRQSVLELAHAQLSSNGERLATRSPRRAAKSSTFARFLTGDTRAAAGSASGDGCEAALAAAGCVPPRDVTTCDLCAGHNQRELRAAGCSDAAVQSWCAGDSAAGASPGRILPADFGADPTGVRDSSQAFEHAIGAAIQRNTSSHQMAGHIADLAGVTIDLDGGDYLISRPIVVPHGYGNLRIAHGTLRASPNFAPNRYLLEISDVTVEECRKIDPKQKSCNENIGV